MFFVHTSCFSQKDSLVKRSEAAARRDNAQERRRTFAPTLFLLDYPITNNSLQKPKKFACPDCTKSFRLKWKLNEHQKNVHAPEQERTCDYCNKPFSSVVTKDRHERNNCPMVRFFFCFLFVIQSLSSN